MITLAEMDIICNPRQTELKLELYCITLFYSCILYNIQEMTNAVWIK